MMQIVKKPCFTLLELLIVLFIISFGILLTGVKVKEVYQEQRFLSEAQQVLSYFSMAQDLMLIMDTDVRVQFAPDKTTEQLQCWLEVEKPIEGPWMRMLERKLLLSAIRSLEFEGNSVKNLTLQFSIGRMSKGKLVLFEEEQDKAGRAEKKQRQFEIELVGYPRPMGVKQAMLKEQVNSEKSELLYPIEVYEKLYADPNEKNTES